MKIKPGILIYPDDVNLPIAWFHSRNDRSKKVVKVRVINKSGGVIYKAVTDKFYDHVGAKALVFFVDKIPEIGEVLRVKKIKPFIGEIVKNPKAGI